MHSTLPATTVLVPYIFVFFFCNRSFFLSYSVALFDVICRLLNVLTALHQLNSAVRLPLFTNTHKFIISSNPFWTDNRNVTFVCRDSFSHSKCVATFYVGRMEIDGKGICNMYKMDRSTHTHTHTYTEVLWFLFVVFRFVWKTIRHPMHITCTRAQQQQQQQHNAYTENIVCLRKRNVDASKCLLSVFYCFPLCHGFRWLRAKTNQ